MPVLERAIVDPEYVNIGSNIIVNRSRYSYALASVSGTAFVQRMLTAVFSFEEVIAATLSGNERKKNEDPEERRKILDQSKVQGLIGKLFYDFLYSH